MSSSANIADWCNANHGTGGLDARSLALMPNRASLGSEDLLYLNRKCLDLMIAPAFLPVSDSAYVAGGSSSGAAKKITIQIGADVDQQMTLSLKDLQVTNTTVIGTMQTYAYNSQHVLTSSAHTIVHWNSIIDVNKMSIGLNPPSASLNAKANIIGKIDMAIDYIANARASMGSQQKRIENTREGLMSYEDNLRAAESKIRDVDMARESSEFAKYQILVNAGLSVLGQANQLPQAVLRLLG